MQTISYNPQNSGVPSIGCLLFKVQRKNRLKKNPHNRGKIYKNKIRTSIKFGVVLFSCIEKGILIHIIYFKNTTRPLKSYNTFLKINWKTVQGGNLFILTYLIQQFPLGFNTWTDFNKITFFEIKQNDAKTVIRIPHVTSQKAVTWPICCLPHESI